MTRDNCDSYSCYEMIIRQINRVIFPVTFDWCANAKCMRKWMIHIRIQSNVMSYGRQYRIQFCTSVNRRDTNFQKVLFVIEIVSRSFIAFTLSDLKLKPLNISQVGVIYTTTVRKKCSPAQFQELRTINRSLFTMKVKKTESNGCRMASIRKSSGRHGWYSQCDETIVMEKQIGAYNEERIPKRKIN